MAALREISAVIEAAAREAGAAALAYFRPGAQSIAGVQYKDGNSPVTDADHAANDILLRRLGDAFPDFAIISEETPDDAARLKHSHALILDPVDGTRGFMAGRLEWCVSVGLAVDGFAVCGVIHAPALGKTFLAAQNGGAFVNGTKLPHCKQKHSATLSLTGPKTLVAEAARILSASPEPSQRLPSLALRFVEVAEAQVDVAFASAGSHEWDSAAAACILAETGCAITALDGAPLRFNQPSLRQPELMACPASLVEVLTADWRLHHAT